MKSTAILMIFSFAAFFPSPWAVEFLYERFYYDVANAACFTAEPYQEDMFPGLKSKALSCALRCQVDVNCTFFSINDTMCDIFTVNAPAGARDDPSGLLLAAYKPLGAPGDLALFKPIITLDSHADYPVPYDTVVNGVTCGKLTKYDCPCTKASTAPYVTVDLQATYDITTIIVTPSISHRAPSVKNIFIRVGDLGTTSDLLVAQRDDSYVDGYIPMVYNVNARGRYVTIHKTYGSGGSLCFCHLQVYGS